MYLCDWIRTSVEHHLCYKMSCFGFFHCAMMLFNSLNICSPLLSPFPSTGSQLEVAFRGYGSSHRQCRVICGHSCQKLNWACNDSQTKPLKQRGTCGSAFQRLSKEGANVVESVASSLSLRSLCCVWEQCVTDNKSLMFAYDNCISDFINMWVYAHLFTLPDTVSLCCHCSCLWFQKLEIGLLEN